MSDLAYGVLPRYRDMNFSMLSWVSRKEKSHEVTGERALLGPLIQTTASVRGLLKLVITHPKDIRELVSIID